MLNASWQNTCLKKQETDENRQKTQENKENQ
jgi:hypothetical protein